MTLASGSVTTSQADTTIQPAKIVDFRGDLTISGASSGLGQTGVSEGGYPPIMLLSSITQRP